MMQKMLDVVYNYSKKYRFRFNQSKSNILIFGRKCNEKFRLGENELEVVDNYKYLGLLLDKNFIWKQHLDKVLDKARKKMRSLCAMGLREGISARMY